MAKRIINNERTRFVSNSDVPLAKKPVAVMLPVVVDEYVRSLPNRTEWLRRVICDAVEKEKSAQQAKTEQSADDRA